MKKIISLIFGFLLGLSALAQTPPFARYLPQPLDSLRQQSLDSLVVYLNDLTQGGIAGEKGLPMAVFHWDEQGRIRSAVVAKLDNNQWGGQDSVAWSYRGDTVIRQQYVLEPSDPDYRDYAPYVDFTATESPDLPPFAVAYDPQVDTTILFAGRVVQKRDGYVHQTYHYDSTGLLQRIESRHLEALAMGMGGLTWEYYEYDAAGQLYCRSTISEGPEQIRDTSDHIYHYNAEGQVITEMIPIPSVPGAMSLRQYAYEAGNLVRKWHQRTTFRSSGPPDYTRTQITLSFETLYAYEGQRLIEEKHLRDDEIEWDGWLRYAYNDQGLLVHKQYLSPSEEAPYLIYTYKYIFQE